MRHGETYHASKVITLGSKKGCHISSTKPSALFHKLHLSQALVNALKMITFDCTQACHVSSKDTSAALALLARLKMKTFGCNEA